LLYWFYYPLSVWYPLVPTDRKGSKLNHNNDKHCWITDQFVVFIQKPPETIQLSTVAVIVAYSNYYI
jgi:hypothetical protein